MPGKFNFKFVSPGNKKQILHRMNKQAKGILPIIVIAQFLCTSLWFAGNAILPDLIRDFGLGGSSLGHITSAVQFGFIAGTLAYALLMIADRFSSSTVFFISAVIGGLTNFLITTGNHDINSILALRFLTGFFLAGIYPVGMKIASDHFEKGLGKALGFLVGALVVGTAFPHLLKSLTNTLSWRMVLMFTAGLSIAGGILMKLAVPDIVLSKKSGPINFKPVPGIFKNRQFRSAAFGYFGHMWELYAFWAFVPVMLTTYTDLHAANEFRISFWAFWIIALGGLACVLSGYLSQTFGAGKTAFTALLLSGCCCLASPLAFQLPPVPFIAFLITWGLAVIADSPLFSTLVAQNVPAQIKGTALTSVTCIGFSITIISIELINYLSKHMNTQFIYLFLAIGPATGLFYMWRLAKKETLA